MQFLLAVLNVSLLIIYRIKFGKKGGYLFNLTKNVRDVLLSFVYLSFICILLLIVGIYLEIYGIPTKLCLGTVM